MMISRRAMVASLGALPAALAESKIPVGVEMYSVRDQLRTDPIGTVQQVAKLGYECLEFYSPYAEWTTAYAKQMRKVMDDAGIRNLSNHTGRNSFAPDKIDHVIELNQILGSGFLIMSSAGKVESLDEWKRVADLLNATAGKLKRVPMRTGFHNHQLEFKPLNGVRPMDILAKQCDRLVTLQLDVGTCIEAGVDPVQWIRQNPGRITSMHCKDWSRDPAVGYHALFGEGAAPWKEIFHASENGGGIEFYLIEQEGSRFEPMETIDRCLKTYRNMRG